MLPICFTHGLALLSHYYKSSTCVCSVIFSLQRRCMGVLCCHFRPKMFSPGDHVRYHSRTLGAHVLATVVGPSPNGTQFCHIRYIRPGGVTPVDHESAQLSRLAPQLRGKPAGLAVQAGAKAAAKPAPRAIASSSTRKSLHTCSLCLRQWRVPQFALRYPCNVPPPPGTPSLGDRLPPPTRETVARYPGTLQGGGRVPTAHRSYHP